MNKLDLSLNHYQYPDKSIAVRTSDFILTPTRRAFGRRIYTHQTFQPVNETAHALFVKIVICMAAIALSPLSLVACVIKLTSARHKQIHELFLQAKNKPAAPLDLGPQNCAICQEPIGAEPAVRTSKECEHEIHIQCQQNAYDAARNNNDIVDPENPNGWDPDYSGCPVCRKGSRRPEQVVRNNRGFVIRAPVVVLSNARILYIDSQAAYNLVLFANYRGNTPREFVGYRIRLGRPSFGLQIADVFGLSGL